MVINLTQEYINTRLYIARAQMADMGMDVLELKYKGATTCYRNKFIKWVVLNNLIESIECYVLGDVNECLTEQTVQNILERIDALAGAPSGYTMPYLRKDTVPGLVSYVNGCC